MEPTSIRNPMRDESLSVPPLTSDPRAFHRRLPGYEPTPLRDVPVLAEALGVGRVFVKDEASRLGLPAFKMLGASWATYRALVERLGAEPRWQTIEDLARVVDPLRPLTLATATDGNHGRALARMARLLGFGARIWVPDNTVAARVDAIASEGAEVVVVRGSYDDAVREAAAAADDRTLVISDTSWDGYETVPAWVIDGYSTIFAEIDEQTAAAALPEPTAVVVPIGVGALAAAVVSHYRRPGQRATKLIGAEPTTAACVLESIRAGRISTLDHEPGSIMAGLNCGTPSAVAWPLVSAGLDWLVAVDDDQARDAVRALHAVGIVAGESGAASLAAARQLRADTGDDVLEPSDTLLLLSTEGATDPVAYRAIVETPEA
ncbi:MAG TPA: diaminopropionate ammonia-lyase [Acidimicrobiales bacterium]